ncbi:MAG: hypothetical protein NTW86_08570 [Candidatus Sumerlaeota bacterium]|nr:hypothetical protein [Candidatus Sumerlaeota bacterium]
MKRIELNGRWEFRELDKGEWLPGRAPGSVHGDLLRNDRIPDPYDRMNELDTLWAGRTDWEYRRTFRASVSFLTSKRQLLVCEGLDTVAEIFLNGEPLGRADNMFRRWEFDAAPFLREGENEIHIVFGSPAREAAERARNTKSLLKWPTPPVFEPYRVTLRKCQCQSGWDWGPCLATCGIWGDILLAGYSGPRIEYAVVDQDHRKTGAVGLRVKAWLDAPDECRGSLVVQMEGQEFRSPVLTLREGKRQVEALTTLAEPELWWPAGQGPQRLYDLVIEWRDAEDDEPTDSIRKRIGLRKVELVRERDKTGESFFFRVNGRPVYAKGANWIPGDLMLERMTRDIYERDLRACVEANMNILRVWGGGIYEKEEFYELCDELGLMVWQDFMFACGLYPAERWFLDNVEAEVRHQVRRLRDHPSIVLWCGNNECEEGLKRWWKDAQTKKTHRDYERLYIETVGRTAAREDASRAFWPSSASNGGAGSASSRSPAWRRCGRWRARRT